MKIGIDLDEILGGLVPELLKFHNDKYKTNFKLEDFFSYKLWEVWGGNREEAIEKIYEFYKTDFFKNIKPIKGSQKAIEKLKKNNELFIITARQNVIKKETRLWVEKNFPNAFSNIHFTNHYAQKEKLKTKKEVCDLLDVDILIEDSLEYSSECVNPKRKIFLMDYPWNKSDNLPKNIERVYSWEEIIDKIQ